MSNLKPCLGTCSCEPCWQPIARNLPREFVLGTRTCSWEPVLRTLAWEPVLAKLALGTLLGDLFPRTLLGNLATLQGNLVLEPLLGNLGHCSWNPCLWTCSCKPCLGTWSCEPCLETCSQEPCLEALCLRTYSWGPFLQPFLGKPCLGTCSWEPGLGIVPGWESFLVTLLANLFLENLIGNLVLGVAEDPKLTLLLGKNVPKQVPRKRLPSRYLGRDSQARLSS